MQAPEHFEFRDRYCCYRLTGHGSLEEAGRKVIEAITFAREHRLPRLLIETTGWTGHDSPGAVERFDLAVAFTSAAGSAVKLAMVVRPELMDPEKFEMRVATNRGLNGQQSWKAQSLKVQRPKSKSQGRFDFWVDQTAAQE